MAEARKYGGFVGGAASFATSVVQQTHPEWFGDHHWITPTSLIVFGASVLLYISQYPWLRSLWGSAPTESHTPRPENVLTASPVITTSPTISGNTQTIEQHFHVFPTGVAAPVPVPIPPDSLVGSAAKRLPTVRLMDASTISAEQNGVRFSKSPDGGLYFVAWVSNPPADVGERADIAHGVAASLIFRTSAGHERHVGRAYWLDSDVNFTTIRVGERKAVILGTKVDSLLHYFDNKREIPFSRRRDGRGIKSYKNLPLLDFVTVEVVLISTQTGHTLGKKTYKIKLLAPDVTTIVEVQALNDFPAEPDTHLRSAPSGLRERVSQLSTDISAFISNLHLSTNSPNHTPQKSFSQEYENVTTVG